MSAVVCCRPWSGKGIASVTARFGFPDDLNFYAATQHGSPNNVPPLVIISPSTNRYDIKVDTVNLRETTVARGSEQH